MEIFCNIINVFTVTFDQFNVPKQYWSISPNKQSVEEINSAWANTPNSWI